MDFAVSEETTFQMKALEVREPDDDFDPKLEPINGDEYLTHMLYERKRCPAVVVCWPKVAPQPILSDNTTAETHTECAGGESATAAQLLPTAEWKSLQADDFRAMRCRIMVARQALRKDDIGTSLPLRDFDDKVWETFCHRNPPVLTTMLSFGQRSLEQLLERLYYWLEPDDDVDEDLLPEQAAEQPDTKGAKSVVERATIDLAGKDKELGAWLYATLACLHLPLEPYVHSTLRDIARSCIRHRERLQPEQLEQAAPFNLFITLIANVFDQLDFADFV